MSNHSDHTAPAGCRWRNERDAIADKLRLAIEVLDRRGENDAARRCGRAVNALRQATAESYPHFKANALMALSARGGV